jgi:hypothetical protein
MQITRKTASQIARKLRNAGLAYDECYFRVDVITKKDAVQITPNTSRETQAKIAELLENAGYTVRSVRERGYRNITVTVD